MHWIFLLMGACVTQELCMKDVQGDWIVDEVTIQSDTCNASKIWEDYYDEPYTFRGSFKNALIGPVDCRFDGRGSSAFYCQDIFPNVYQRAWNTDFVDLSTSPGGWAEDCTGTNVIPIDGSSNGLVVAEDEIIVQFYGSAYCPSSDLNRELYCDVDIQWVLKPINP
ncbi:MAG: hypothetical protein ACON4U_03825 [Myxococcota bacterium]